MAHENRAALHVQQDGGWVQAYERQPDAQSPAGGASSSVRDMAQWIRLQLGHGMVDGTQWIDANALGMTHLVHAVSELPAPPYDRAPNFYGLGWSVGFDPRGNVSLGHSGAFALGAATTVYLRPGDDIGIVVLTNGFPIGVAETVGLSILDLATHGSVQHDYLAIIGDILASSMIPQYGDAILQPPADVTPPFEIGAYLGRYTNDFFGDLEMIEDEQGLAMRLGPNEEIFPLTHFTRDVFTFTPIGENAGRDSAVIFTVGADSLASRVVVEILDAYHAGTFIRG